MKKTIIFFIQLLCVLTALFAERSLDDAIYAASKDITSRCEKNTKLVIYDFNIQVTSVSKQSDRMAKEISRRFRKFLYASGIEIVIRDSEKLEKREKELVFQHNSGKVNPNTIISVGNLLGANTALVGNFYEESGKYSLSIELLNLNNGTYIFSDDYRVPFSKEIDELLGNAASYKKVGLGLGVEANRNSREDFIAPGISASFDYNASKKLSLGFKVFASYDVKAKDDNNLLIFETLAFLRIYMVSHSGEPGTGAFLEGLGGVSFVSSINSPTKHWPNGGLGLGYRLPLKWFYIEPELRFGYPYTYGASVNFGFRF